MGCICPGWMGGGEWSATVAPHRRRFLARSQRTIMALPLEVRYARQAPQRAGNTDMRAILVVSLVALLCPAAAIAQTAAAPSAAPSSSAAPAAKSAAPTRGGDITRDDYIQRAVDRARRAAEKRFDQMDANHDGVLTAEERRAARAQRRASQSQ